MKFILNRNTKVIYHSRIYTAEDLSVKINALMRKIRTYKVQNKRIMLFMDRTPDLVCAMLAVIGLRMTYVPVSVHTPQNRLDYIISDSQITLVVTNVKYKNLFIGIPCIFVENISMNVCSKLSVKTPHASAAYIIYTSGTTGKPKGVEVGYDAIGNFVEGLKERIQFQEYDVMAFFTDISFDISFVESVFAAIMGMTIVLADEEEQNNPQKIIKLICENNVTILQMTPSRMQLVRELDNEFKCLSQVRTIMVGGEVFTVDLLRILKKNTAARIYNLYGPTEATIWTSIADLTDFSVVKIGKPMLNTEIFIIDARNRLVKHGDEGEIAIAGKGLAKGYINDSVLTKQKFIYPSFLRGKRLYKTGDIGKYDENGYLEYIGRYDNQIKLNGHRIELEEIESVINEFHLIEEAIVICEMDILIVIYKEKGEVNIDDLRKYLKNILPHYMIPSIYYKIGTFAYTLNGKIDRRETYKNIKNSIKVQKEDFEENEIEKKIIDIIKLVILVPGEISISDGFEELGVDSLKWIRLIVAIEKTFNFEFDDNMLSNSIFPNVESLINYVEEKVKKF